MNNRIVIAAGGTGGHVFPAQTISDELEKRGLEITLVADDRVLSMLGGSLKSAKLIKVNSSRIAGNILSRIRAVHAISMDIMRMILFYLLNRPTCVIGFGGYPTFPAMCAAVLLRIPIFAYEPNSVLGATNRWLMPFVDTLFAFMPNILYLKERYKYKTRLVKPLVRQELVAVSKKRRSKNEKFTILVIGGSQGARIFSEVVPQALSTLPKETRCNIKVIQQARPENVDSVIAQYNTLSIEATVKPFFEDMAYVYYSSDIIICRSGASTLSELIAFRLPAILIPYPYAADRHQYYNALYITDAGAGVIINDDQLSVSSLSALLSEFINDKEKLKGYKKAYEKLACNTSIDDMCDIIEARLRKQFTNQ